MILIPGPGWAAGRFSGTGRSLWLGGRHGYGYVNVRARPAVLIIVRGDDGGGSASDRGVRLRDVLTVSV